MNTAVLNQPRSMAFGQAVSKPLLSRIWSALVQAGAARAVTDLRREAAMRIYSNPELARQLLQTARDISVE